MLWRHRLAGLALCAAMLPATGNAAVTEDTFQLRTTSDLVELCSIAPIGSDGHRSAQLLSWLHPRGLSGAGGRERR